MKKTNKPNPLKVFNDNKVAAYKKAGGAMKEFKKSLPKAQNGRTVADKTRVDNPYKNNFPKRLGEKPDPEKLTYAEMNALSHQYRGMGEKYGSYVKKSDPILNERGQLTSKQQTQLKSYMSKQPMTKKIYEALPNIGRVVGNSAADIPKGSKLKEQKKGGSVKKKMAAGGSSDSDCWPGKPGCGAEKARRVNKRRRFWNSDAGKTVKKVGAGVAAAGAGVAAYAKNAFGVKDAIKGLSEQKKGGSVKRKK